MNHDHGPCMEDVQGLRVFLAVAENLSFTRAAESLLLTQSAVSHQIARLEREVGTPLLLRQGRTTALTPVGRELVVHARRVMAALADATTAVRQAARPGAGRLRVGATAAACQHLIPEALREFRECFPDYSLSILPADSPAVLDRLADGTLDLGVVVRADRVDRPSSRLAYHDLFADELGALVSPLHPWARAGKVDRRQLGEQRLILFSRQSATFRIVERYLAKMGAPLRDFIELGSMEAIKELVKMGPRRRDRRRVGGPAGAGRAVAGVAAAARRPAPAHLERRRPGQPRADRGGGDVRRALPGRGRGAGTELRRTPARDDAGRDASTRPGVVTLTHVNGSLTRYGLCIPRAGIVPPNRKARHVAPRDLQRPRHRHRLGGRRRPDLHARRRRPLRQSISISARGDAGCAAITEATVGSSVMTMISAPAAFSRPTSSSFCGVMPTAYRMSRTPCAVKYSASARVETVIGPTSARPATAPASRATSIDFAVFMCGRNATP